MNDKENVFKFSLYQENVLLGEKIFSADLFNPFTRYSVNIRSMLPKTITKFQKVLSKKKYDVVFDVGNGKQYDFFHHNQNYLNSLPRQVKEDLKYHPETKVYQIENKTIRGVECKLGLYINDNPIVEREFYVDGFNPISRYSWDVLELVIETADKIFKIIKTEDIHNMWDDYDLINKMGLNINQIRELPPTRRYALLNRLKK